MSISIGMPLKFESAAPGDDTAAAVVLSANVERIHHVFRIDAGYDAAAVGLLTVAVGTAIGATAMTAVSYDSNTGRTKVSAAAGTFSNGGEYKNRLLTWASSGAAYGIVEVGDGSYVYVDGDASAETGNFTVPTTVFQTYVHNAETFDFAGGVISANEIKTLMTVTLAAGGSGIAGKLTVGYK